MKHSEKQFRELNLGDNAFPSVDDYCEILLDSIPVIDIRSPSEFARGAVPNAVNLPLLTDAERDRVGITYREKGQTSAILQGLELLPQTKQNLLIAEWIQFLEKHPDALICCWRGGLRSKIVQSWLHDKGWQVPRIVGGSKALRAFCLSSIDTTVEFNFVVLAGRTGSGKTQLINELIPAIDLEGLACHRGSAFGGDTAAQPPPIRFESSLAGDLLRITKAATILVEDESRVIGKLAIPESLFTKMRCSPVVVLRVDEEKRVQYIYDGYVRNTNEAVMLANLEKIQKRLGLEHYNEIRTSLCRAYKTQQCEDHRIWLSLLLQYYYDPMYDYQLARKKDRVIFQGSKEDVKDFLKTDYGFASH